MQKVIICGKQAVLNRWKEYLSDLPKEDTKKRNTHIAMLQNIYRTLIHLHCK
jgi:hypothetical protein